MKTLKDLQKKGNEEDYTDCFVVSTTSLINEAIHWIKALDEEAKDYRPRELDNYHTKLSGLAAKAKL